ncbi:MAG TPA: hypothetical protein VFT42_06025 [Solirubrobacteraceae bacterium]|nr:hypothetical protein [Solirubrobacteraceae bacterium]
MRLTDLVRLVNRGMVGFDLALGAGALLAPDATLGALGHGSPSGDARALFRRCGPIWLTYACAHAVAARRGRSEDWAGVAWLRATEIATDVVWSRSPAFSAPRSRAALWMAGAFNAALAAGAAREARLL